MNVIVFVAIIPMSAISGVPSRSAATASAGPTYSKMIQNLAWATGYNLVAIPVAAGVFVPWGLDLPMAVGAIAMSVSTIVGAANAQLLRRLQLRRAAAPSPLTPA